MQRTKVFIAFPAAPYYRMFTRLGFQVTSAKEDADLICFTGGPDVHPQIYGEEKSLRTNAHMGRDLAEKEIFEEARAKHLPMVGICRGGQFLNVMCGGKLWQHVDGHAGGVHKMYDQITGEELMVSSTHHQMMIPTEEATIIALADESSEKMRMLGTVGDIHPSKSMSDVEVVSYPNYNVLCYQPHPEIGVESNRCETYFAELIERELGVS